MNLFSLEGTVSLITGSTKGIGRGVAERMAAAGAKVIVSSRNQADCDATADELNSKFAQGRNIAAGIAADIADIGQLQQLVDGTLETWGQIDTLVCNAAMLAPIGRSAATGYDEFQRVVNTNVHHTFRLCHMVLPGMVARRSGSVIVMGSIAGHVALPTTMAYSVSKAALAHLVRCLAAEFAPHNVRVNCISPGLIRSFASQPLWENEEVLQSFTRNIPLGRIGEPDDVAATAIFLSSQGGSFVTGAVIPVDGGAISLPRPTDSDPLTDVWDEEHRFD